MNAESSSARSVTATPAETVVAAGLTRREAIRRTATLLGLTLSPAWLDALVAAPAAAATAKPAHLNAAQFATAGAVAERLLPRTDTPGASDVGVPAFIDRIVGGFMSDTEKATLLAGLADLDARSQRAHGKAFAALDAAAQDALLRTVAAESQRKEKTFFHLIRDLTLIGYFTSEEVGRNVTNFEPIPGRFEPCIPLSEVGNRAWTR